MKKVLPQHASLKHRINRWNLNVKWRNEIYPWYSLLTQSVDGFTAVTNCKLDLLELMKCIKFSKKKIRNIIFLFSSFFKIYFSLSWQGSLSVLIYFSLHWKLVFRRWILYPLSIIKISVQEIELCYKYY